MKRATFIAIMILGFSTLAFLVADAAGYGGYGVYPVEHTDNGAELFSWESIVGVTYAHYQTTGTHNTTVDANAEYFAGITVSSATVGTVCNVYNSATSTAAANLIMEVDMGTLGYYPAFSTSVSGVTIKVLPVGENNGVTLFYKR